MDNEIGEGLHLGVNLIISVAIAVMLVTISGIIRTGYIYRERDVRYNNTVMERMVWQELNYYADYTSGVANKRHLTDTDSTLKFVTDHCQDIPWIVFIQNVENTGYNAYYNCTLSNTEKANVGQVLGYGYINWIYVNPLDITENNAMVDQIYSINSERFIINQVVQNKVKIYACQNKQTLSGDKTNIKFIQWFEQDFILPDLGIAVFHIY